MKTKEEILAECACIDLKELEFKNEVQIIRPSEALEAMQKHAEEIVIHSFEFAVWFKEDENFMKVYFDDEVKYRDQQNFDEWSTDPQLEKYFTLNQIYQYWLRINN